MDCTVQRTVTGEVDILMIIPLPPGAPPPPPSQPPPHQIDENTPNPPELNDQNALPPPTDIMLILPALSEYPFEAMLGARTAAAVEGVITGGLGPGSHPEVASGVEWNRGGHGLYTEGLQLMLGIMSKRREARVAFLPAAIGLRDRMDAQIMREDALRVAMVERRRKARRGMRYAFNGERLDGERGGMVEWWAREVWRKTIWRMWLTNWVNWWTAIRMKVWGDRMYRLSVDEEEEDSDEEEDTEEEDDEDGDEGNGEESD
ncbi:hypothetical protein EJ06DRAFT_556216 [Trichodelitschia bisporula]|uniref:Uncharacterized protein n=1 Tax=Trichodelitschia bisporula TaxID=703511 RepID=A0A6G1HXA6_9PEZI|nr:hypothetical protein EJ06DRAFT_556216 [Trichodelitschia bisporula]